MLMNHLIPLPYFDWNRSLNNNFLGSLQITIYSTRDNLFLHSYILTQKLPPILNSRTLPTELYLHSSYSLIHYVCLLIIHMSIDIITCFLISQEFISGPHYTFCPLLPLTNFFPFSQSSHLFNNSLRELNSSKILDKGSL